MEQVTLKLVGAKTFISPRVKNKKDNMMVKGETHAFDAPDAEALLKEEYRDALGNDHPLFVEVAAGRSAQREEESAPAKTSRQRVSRRKAASAGEQGEEEGQGE